MFLYSKFFLLTAILLSSRGASLKNKLIKGWPQHAQTHKGEQWSWALSVQGFLIFVAEMISKPGSLNSGKSSHVMQDKIRMPRPNI